MQASRIPLVYLTSNNTRELSEALKRRCLYLHLDYPSLERETADRRDAGSGCHRGADRPGGEDRPVDQGPRAEEGTVSVGDSRLGAHPRRARGRDDRRRRGKQDTERAAQVQDGSRPGCEGARPGRALHGRTAEADYRACSTF